jgi:hypothetical protein
MRKCRKVALALATLITVVLLALTTTSHAQDGQRVVNLGPGCNMVTLTFASGTQATAVAAAVSPPEALDTIWRHDNATRSFQAFMPQAPQASDLTSVNLLDAVFICVDAVATIAMPAVSSDPASAPISVNLSTGCNAVGLTFSDGTAPSGLAEAITPAEAFESLWRLENATGSFQAYVAAAPQASDLTSLQFLDAVFICTSGPAALATPAVTAPAAVGPLASPVATSDDAVRYIMEAAVPQVVDLPPGFEAVDEYFGTPDSSGGPPGWLYFYNIAYENPSALTDIFGESLAFTRFQLVLFDTVTHAESYMKEFTSVSADALKEDWAADLAESARQELGSLTIEQVEHLTTIGEEASFIRVKVQIRSLHSEEAFVPVAQDYYMIRRDRVIGEVSVMWSAGPPGSRFVTEKLAKQMDAGIQEALPELLAAIQ